MSCGSGGFGGGQATPAVVGSGVIVANDGVEVGLFDELNFEGVTVTDDGGGIATISVSGRPLFLPEQWAENNVQRNLVNHVMDCQVSTSFDTFKVITSGSVTAISTRLSQPITAGTMTVVVTKNGAAQAALTLVHTNVSNNSGGAVSVPAGTIVYAPGDLIGAFISTDNALSPTSTDIETMIQVTE